MRLALVLAALAVFAGAGWYLNAQQLAIARLERDLQAERGLRATENATRQAQARRAIETAQRQESESRTRYEAIDAQMQEERARAAADHAAAERRRVRDIAAARAATAARGGRLPETAPAPAGGVGVDPLGFLLAIRSEDEADAGLADDLARRLTACEAGRRSDRARIGEVTP